MPEAMNPAKQAEGFLDKFQHPFVSSFISSWVICNWDVFYTLLGGLKDPFDTVAKIKTQYPFCDHYGHLILLPILGMVSYVFIGPWLLNWYLLYKHKLEVKRKFNEEVANGHAPVNQNDYSRLQADRMNDLRENEVLRMLIDVFKNQSITIPGEGTGNAKNFVQQFFYIKEENNRLKKELLELRAKNIGFKVMEPKPLPEPEDIE
jgi:hypothetical protein